jgi:hypothetical protein
MLKYFQRQLNLESEDPFMTKKELFEGRRKRIDDVIALKEPDRVPLAPKIGFYTSLV